MEVVRNQKRVGRDVLSMGRVQASLGKPQYVLVGVVVERPKARLPIFGQCGHTPTCPAHREVFHRVRGRCGSPSSRRRAVIGRRHARTNLWDDPQLRLCAGVALLARTFLPEYVSATIRHSVVCFLPLAPWVSTAYFDDMVGRMRAAGIDEFVLYWAPDVATGRSPRTESLRAGHRETIPALRES